MKVERKEKRKKSLVNICNRTWVSEDRMESIYLMSYVLNMESTTTTTSNKFHGSTK